ncbi:patatin family protein [Thalassobacillus devorans]|uniref:Patatin family protein n=1 Tax=Thalassobacillus devorans TaxID=279813 RepID=A0ABQ1NKU0_9BACI|nr:patatin family protein [Thalassobacillus devorans]NIK27694.1 putative patatin/cPLA2 family phospholipase [Thalassobacillus devorans]GGC79771.1 patatin family protein [Thalassobacillus devorans]
MEKTGLVLEGGGMRGTYTAGVLDYFLDMDLHFPYVIGASAGASNGSSYVAKQRGRNYDVLVGYGDHPEYISFKRAFRQKELFGMDFIFDKLPNELVPFDYDTFEARKTMFAVATTDMETGMPHYYDDFPDRNSLLTIMRASCSIPLISPSIPYDGKYLMDGGIADPVPIERSIEQGNEKHVVVLTRNQGYMKKRMRLGWYIQRKFKQYPKFVDSLLNRHDKYNQLTRRLYELEKEGKVFIIRPDEPLAVGRVERNKRKLHNLYMQGYNEMRQKEKALEDFLKA